MTTITSLPPQTAASSTSQPEAVHTEQPTSAGALEDFPEFDFPAQLRLAAGSEAPTLALPLGMDEQEYMLELNKWSSEFTTVVLENAKANIQQTIDFQKAKLKTKLAELKEMWRKQDAAAAAARRNRIIGWVTKSLTMVALVAATVVSVAAAVAVPGAGAILLAVTLTLMAGAATTAFASQAHSEIHGEDDQFSLTSALAKTTLNGSEAGYLGSILSADLSGLGVQIAKEWTDDATDLAIVGAVCGAVQTLVMCGAGASGSAANASKMVTGIQITGTLASGATGIASGVTQLELAKVEREIAGIMVRLTQLNALLEMIDKVLKGQIEFQKDCQEHAMKVRDAVSEVVNGINDRMVNLSQNMSPAMG